MKLVVQSRGSENDPSYEEIDVGGVSFPEYFRRQGIGTLERDLVNSCHGCTEMTLRLAKEVQSLADDGDSVVAVAAGGLYWAKLGIEAANMPTVFPISVPLDGGYFKGLDAFLAPMLPSGTAAIGGVGIGQYGKAARVAREVLMNEFEGVFIYKGNDRLRESLGRFGVEVLGEIPDDISRLDEGLVVGCLDDVGRDSIQHFETYGVVGIFTPPKSFQPYDSVMAMRGISEHIKKSVWTRGEVNVAILAAKAVSSYNGNAFDALKEAAIRKRESYEERSITLGEFR